ncbi:MAG TPA: OmpA family protein [Alphaproteobacteria bacterium]|nr:OmpA family protein [Alphaproteobacteria bacterium]
MLKFSLPVLLASASTVALGFVQPAFAQNAAQPEASSTGLEEVVVTARRREEKAQTVPIALTTLTAARLEKQDIRDNLSLLKDTPGLNGSTGASLGVSYTFLRGVSGVVSYFDEIPTAVTGVNQSYYFDVSNVQVLKGPQGTLFGLSNDAGAILYEPTKPTNNYEGYVKATLGNYGRGTFEAVVNVPVDDKLSIRVGGQFNHQDGYIHVISNNIDLLDQNYWSLRGQASFHPTDDIDNELLVNYFHSRYRPGTFVFDGYSDTAPQAFPVPVNTLVGILHGVNPKDFPEGDLGPILARQRQLGPYKVQALSLDPSAQVSQLNIVDKFTYDINDNLQIKNILAYSETINSAFIQDIDATNLALIQGNTLRDSQGSGPSVQYNEELQFLGKAFNDKLTYVVGTFNQLGGYGSADTRAPYGIGYQNSFGQTKGATQVNRARTDAVYAQGTYNLGDYIEGLSFTAGIRYTWDHFYTRGSAYDENAKFLGTLAQSANYRAPSYTWSIDYQWRPQTMFYFTNSRGYKTGGFNNTPTQIFESFSLFAPEHLNNFELGMKSDFDLEALGAPDMKARVNLSGYYGVYQNIQVQTTGAYLVQGGPRTGSLGTPILNVGNGDIWGYEGEFTLIPISSFEFNANFAYSRGSYSHFMGPNPNPAPGAPAQVYIPGVNYEITPLWKFNLNGTYHIPVDPAYGELSVSLAYSWQDRMILTDAPKLAPQDYLPAFDNVDMTLDWKGIMGNDQLDGRLWVTNLLNNTIAPGVLATWEVLGLIGYQPAQPQMYGATLKYSFGGEGPAPAEAAAYVPPPVAAPAPAPKSYLVFFDFNKSDLTPQAKDIVDTAAKNASATKVTQLTVTGHTDTVGSDAYNMRLSRRRAESVAAQLEKDGVPSSEIEIVAKGKRDLLVPTADGVREPQNRRVQIVFDGGPTS